MIKRVYTGVAYKYKEMKVSYMNSNHNIVKGGLKCQIFSYNRESMRLFTMIIEKSIFCCNYEKNMHPKPGDWFIKKGGGLCGGRGRCRCWGRSVGQFWLCG
jgi:hypothetical protein